MIVIRPVEPDDLEQLLGLAGFGGFGLTTLPKDRKLLERRVGESQRGFAKPRGESPRGESFLFVMEEIETGQVVGTSSLVSKVGGFQPFYAYRMEDTVLESEMLKVRKRIPTLHLVTQHDGPCDVGGLFLAPDCRGSGHGRLLSLARFVFMAEYPEHFDAAVVAEMRGVIDEHGRSVFWDALGKHFFEVDFPTADYLSVVDKKFIAELMPQHPIYIPLMPPEAQAVIQQVHPLTRPALYILEQEGFRSSDMMDIFDAGPILACPRNRIRSVRQSVQVTIDQIVDRSIEAVQHIIARTDQGFCACAAPLEMLSEERARVSGAAARALGLQVGDLVRAVTLRPSEDKVQCRESERFNSQSQSI